MNEEPNEPVETQEKRGLSWAVLVSLLVLTLMAALVIAYLITKHNFPAR